MILLLFLQQLVVLVVSQGEAIRCFFFFAAVELHGRRKLYAPLLFGGI